ncbi:MPD2 (YOL088C) [Zygosaccharomyces parabailii]|nr:MPD2 (YOL088C) [Zygosaccharomyces parabailii]CDH10562.1 related to Protein disulfide isomerase MPD2 [Zygosaccharomyces bailii ISA1307]
MKFQSLVHLLLCASAALGSSKSKKVDLLWSVDEYYDQVNSVEQYTMLEYTTTWCHHCKELKPVFDELMLSYEGDESKPSIRFMDVSCELFGSQVCHGLRAFPHISFIVPRDEPLEVHVDYAAMPFAKRWWKRLVHRLQDPKWQLDEDRVFVYDGDRDVESMRNFIDTIRGKDKQRRLAVRVLDPAHTCEGEDDVQLCEEGKGFLAELDESQLDREISRLENLIENNSDEQLGPVKFKLQIVEQLQSKKEKEEKEKKKQAKISEHDEL